MISSHSLTSFGVALFFSFLLCPGLGSGKDDDDCSDDEEDDGGDVDEGGGSVGDEEQQPAMNEVRVESFCFSQQDVFLSLCKLKSITLGNMLTLKTTRTGITQHEYNKWLLQKNANHNCFENEIKHKSFRSDYLTDPSLTICLLSQS